MPNKPYVMDDRIPSKRIIIYKAFVNNFQYFVNINVIMLVFGTTLNFIYLKRYFLPSFFYSSLSDMNFILSMEIAVIFREC